LTEINKLLHLKRILDLKGGEFWPAN